MEILSGVLICARDKVYKKRQLAAVNTHVVHRCFVGKTLSESAEAFRDTKEFAAGFYTGGKWPYHYYILKDGTVYNCLSLASIAPAAMKTLNNCGVHTALEGDFRKESPGPLQVAALLQLHRHLEAKLGKKLKLRGHTDEAGASSDPNKQCPGHKLILPKT